ncbi:MAG: phospholipase D-like domain-containing protein [Nitrospirota bacterium]
MKRILQPGVNCMGLYEVESTGLVVDGYDYYRFFYRAAKNARRYILITGWQFDSAFALLRGGEAEEAGGEVTMLRFLAGLCEDNPDLEIYILAWDFIEFYLVKREWFQDRKFNRSACERLHFRFDSRHAVGASHHEKFVVVDGELAFAGGLDLCSSRWDQRDHRLDNPLRRDRMGKHYEPYHDTQSCHTGPLARQLAEVFKVRWENSGGEKLDLPEPAGEARREGFFTIPISAREVAISRTRAKTIVPHQESVQEIRSLYVDAVSAAERLIYIENQYFSSQAVYKALVDRMRAPGRPKLQIIFVLPKRPHSLLEEVSLSFAQSKMLKNMIDIASSEGHSLGIYYRVAGIKDGAGVPVHIHSKLLLVDDRFLTVGSANTTNRSMGLDTEINVAWEAHSEEQGELRESLREVRLSLLREHTGLGEDEDHDLQVVEGLVERLEVLATSSRCRLRHHTLETLVEEGVLPSGIGLEDLKVDPETPILEENIFELMARDETGLFRKGVNLLGELLVYRRAELWKYLAHQWRRWWRAAVLALGLALLVAVILIFLVTGD